jgi:hypothetical protein
LERPKKRKKERREKQEGGGEEEEEENALRRNVLIFQRLHRVNICDMKYGKIKNGDQASSW